jgi:hypothetical protein
MCWRGTGGANGSTALKEESRACLRVAGSKKPVLSGNASPLKGMRISFWRILSEIQPLQSGSWFRSQLKWLHAFSILQDLYADRSSARRYLWTILDILVTLTEDL